MFSNLKPNGQSQPATNHQSVSPNRQSKNRSSTFIKAQTMQSMKPQHVQYIESILYQHGIEHYEKSVASQLLEFMNYYTTEIINEGHINRRYRDREGESSLNGKDIKLAIKFKQMNAFQRPMENNSIQNVAQEKNSVPLAKLVLEKHAFVGGNQTVIQDSKLLQERVGLVNLNAMPQKGAALFRLDHANIQINSEELMDKIKEKQREVYGIPITSPFMQMNEPSLQTSSSSNLFVIKRTSSPQQDQHAPSNLGKRDQLEGSPVITFDQKSMMQDIAENKESVEQFKMDQSKILAANTTLNTTIGSDNQNKYELEKRQKLEISHFNQGPSSQKNITKDEEIDFDNLDEEDEQLPQQVNGQLGINNETKKETQIDIIKSLEINFKQSNDMKKETPVDMSKNVIMQEAQDQEDDEDSDDLFGQ